MILGEIANLIAIKSGIPTTVDNLHKNILNGLECLTIDSVDYVKTVAYNAEEHIKGPCSKFSLNPTTLYVTSYFPNLGVTYDFDVEDTK